MEQPSGSSMTEHPRMMELVSLSVAKLLPKIVMERVWLGPYGHISPKLCKLWGDAPWIPLLKNRLTKEDRHRLKRSGKEVTKTYRDKQGQKRCCGGPVL